MKKINLLIVEDSDDDAVLMTSKLKEDGFNASYRIVDNEEDFVKAVSEGSWDVILCDYNIPGFSGDYVLETYKKTGFDIPFIVISGTISAEEAVDILKSGAHDYIDKGNLLRLPHVLDREIKDALVRSQNRENIRKLKESEKNLRMALEQAVLMIGDIVEKRDPYTSGHQKRVAGLAVKMAKKLGFSRRRLETVRFASLIHDLGKINIPSSILSKPGSMSDIEMEMIRAHPENGYNILKNNEFIEHIAKIVYQHHERIDGSGYPLGIAGDEIVLEARILGVADVVEAMSSHRPYRAALGLDAALDEIVSKKNILYDSSAVDACVEICRKKDFSF
jgi:putative two-component system response regulator